MSGLQWLGWKVPVGFSLRTVTEPEAVNSDTDPGAESSCPPGVARGGSHLVCGGWMRLQGPCGNVSGSWITHVQEALGLSQGLSWWILETCSISSASCVDVKLSFADLFFLSQCTKIFRGSCIFLSSSWLLFAAPYQSLSLFVFCS